MKHIPSQYFNVKECAREVFREMGSGHSEAVYEACLALELQLYYGEPVTRQIPCTLKYKGYAVGVGFIDILINDFPIEIKAVAKITPKDAQQVRKYLDALDLDNGLLINFGNDLEFVEVTKQISGVLTVPFPLSKEEMVSFKEAWEKGNNGEIDNNEATSPDS